MKLRWSLLFVAGILGGAFLLSTHPAVSAQSGTISQPRTGGRNNSRARTLPSSNATAAEVISAVNELRTSRGLNALSTHSILMQVAADQANALAATDGAIGHERPCGITLGQDLLKRGYPLAGALSLDGYRSENWVTAETTEEAIRYWLGDEPHTNTMISEHRSDIGAAVVTGNQTYIVLETALQTASGQMQYEASAILTGIPMTQAACFGIATEYAGNSLLPQYSIPVIRSTALPDGEVLHEVKYGQTLWSIAIQYGTTIIKIRQLNNLANDVLQPGQKLLVMRGATQTAPDQVEATPIPASVDYAFIITPVPTISPTLFVPTVTVSSGEFIQQNGMVISFLIISFAFLLVGMGIMGKRRS
jgi:uncharacterized protein YkwD